MKIVVFGGSGLIGKKLVGILGAKGHQVTAASPSSGVDILTGAGVADVLRGTEVVIDVVNSPSFADEPVMRFFQTAASVILPQEEAAGVRHHIALSVVGSERVPDAGYLRAKLAQEAAIRASRVPYTIARATQFFEFIAAIAEGSAKGETIPLTSAQLQPIAADDVAAGVAAIVDETPANAMVELAGPEKIGLDELVRRLFAVTKDPRRVITDVNAGYFGALIDDGSLTAGPEARLGRIRYDDWLAGLSKTA